MTTPPTLARLRELRTRTTPPWLDITGAVKALLDLAIAQAEAGVAGTPPPLVPRNLEWELQPIGLVGKLNTEIAELTRRLADEGKDSPRDLYQRKTLDRLTRERDDALAALARERETIGSFSFAGHNAKYWYDLYTKILAKFGNLKNQMHATLEANKDVVG